MPVRVSIRTFADRAQLHMSRSRDIGSCAIEANHHRRLCAITPAERTMAPRVSTAAKLFTFGEHQQQEQDEEEEEDDGEAEDDAGPTFTQPVVRVVA